MENKITKPTVLMLLSDKRSGSTMFEKELCKHPQISHVSYSPHTYFETHHWLKSACVLNLPASEFYDGNVYKGYGSRKNARKYLIDCIKGNVPDFTVPPDDEKLVFEGWNELCRQFGKPVFFEKSPQYLPHWSSLTLILRWLRTTSFNVKFIVLIRNPLAVQYSAAEAFFTNPEKRQYGWAQAYRNLLAFREMAGKEKFMEIKYESLIENPKEIFKNIFTFIGLEACKESGEHIHKASAQKWQEDPFFSMQLQPSVIQIAEHFGYTEFDLFNPPKQHLPLSTNISKTCSGFYKLNRDKFISRFLKPQLLPILKRLKKHNK